MNTPLVCDYGTGLSKVGFSGLDVPHAVFPTILGKLRHDDWLVGLDEEDWFLGAEVQGARERLSLRYPISRATITNWDHMEKLWHYSFYQLLRVAPEQHPLMLAEPPLNPASSKEKVLQILFETFCMPALYLANQAVLSLFAAGLTSGTTIESGEGMTHVVPIVEGCPLRHSTMQMSLAGQDLTMYLLQLLSAKGSSLVGTGDREYVRDLKEKCCYVALDFDKEKVEPHMPLLAQKCRLPDGQEIELGQERFLCPEALFQPDLVGTNSLGIHMTAFRSISSCSAPLWKVLFGHVVLAGGTGACSGLKSRMQRELAALATPTVKVAACPYTTHSAWVGGSILGSLSSFKDTWVTRADYKDMGPSVISRRPF